MSSSVLADAWTPPGELWVPPRYATPRGPALKSSGPAVARIAAALGLPLMPWQTYTATVGGEVVDGSRPSERRRGRYVHQLVIVSVPRQAGKSALMLAQALQRCLEAEEQEVWFTAQTGKDATDLYRKFVARLLRSPLRHVVDGKPAYRGGSECVTFVNGSTLRPFAPGRDALHGKQSDHVSVDECWKFDQAQGADLFQAITPTQQTRPGAQTWLWSTRGDAQSVWFHDLVQRATEGQEGMALFDWGLPAGVKPTPENVAPYHPAVGHTQSLDSLRAAAVTLKDPAEYARAMGNVASGARVQVIPSDAWDAARTAEDLPDGTPAYGVAVWEPRDGGDVSGALVAATMTADGVPVLEVVEHRPGRSWLVDRVLALRDRGQAVAVLRRGPAGPVADQLELAGVEILEVSGTDYAAACQEAWDRLCDDAARVIGPRLLHRDDPRMDAAVDVAGRRYIGEGAWVWSAKESTGDIACLEAGTLAARALTYAPAPVVIGRSAFLAG